MIGPSMGPGAPKKKKSKQDRAEELRAAEREVRGTSGAGVDYGKMAARVGDGHPSSGGVAAAAPAERSAAFDSFMRLQCGQDGRTIDDKINDKSRPTWEQYKKDNEDRLHLDGAETKKMLAYRAELDAERAAKLASRSKTHVQNDDLDAASAASSSSSSSDSSRKRKKREKKKLKKKAKKKARKKLEKKAAKKRKRAASDSA